MIAERKWKNYNSRYFLLEKDNLRGEAHTNCFA